METNTNIENSLLLVEWTRYGYLYSFDVNKRILVTLLKIDDAVDKELICLREHDIGTITNNETVRFSGNEFEDIVRYYNYFFKREKKKVNLDKKEHFVRHLGNSVYIDVRSKSNPLSPNSNVLEIIIFQIPNCYGSLKKHSGNIESSNFRFTLNEEEFTQLIRLKSLFYKYVPSMENRELCYDTHDNQLAELTCKRCRPYDYKDYEF